MRPSEGFFLAHLLVTALLCGLIWTIQWVHYPLMRAVSPESWPGYHQGHLQRMGQLVIPPMLLELGLAVTLAMLNWGWLHGLALGLTLTIWAVTFAGAVPLHRRLESGHDRALLQALCRLNCLRTLLWTLKLGWLASAWITS